MPAAGLNPERGPSSKRSGDRARFEGLAGESERKMPMPRVLNKARHFEDRPPRRERPDRRPSEGGPHVVPRRGRSRRGGGGRGFSGASRGGRGSSTVAGVIRPPTLSVRWSEPRRVPALPSTMSEGGNVTKATEHFRRASRIASSGVESGKLGYVAVETATRTPSLTPDAGRSVHPSPRSEARRPAGGAAAPSHPRRARSAKYRTRPGSRE